MVNRAFISGWGLTILGQLANNNYSYWLAWIASFLFFITDIIKNKD